MNAKERLCAVIGGCVGALLTMVVCSLSPLGAQNEVKDAKFGTIACRRLLVEHDSESVGDLGMDIDATTEITPTYISIRLGARGERSTLLTASGMNVSEGVFSKITCEELEVVQSDGKRAVRIFPSVVHVHDSMGTLRASVSASGESGSLAVLNEEGNPMVLIASGEEVLEELGGDSGHVFVFGKGMSERVRLSSDKYGGRVRVSGKDEKSRAAMAVSERGNGVLATWDKNGYRLK